MKASTLKSKLLLVTFVSMYFCFCIADSGMPHVAGTAESPDSTISVIAWFCKNDTMKYRRMQSEYTLENGDTVKTKSGTVEDFMLVVKDSTSKGYLLELIPLSVSVNDEDSADVTGRLVDALKEQFGDMRALVRTDEMGVVQGIENWKEIRDKMKGGIKLAMDSLYSATPAMDSVVPRSRYEALMTLAYSTEKGILSAYDELTLLFGLHGKAFDIGKTVVDETKKDSVFTEVFAGYKPYGDDGSSMIII